MACRGVTLRAEDVSNFKGDIIVSKSYVSISQIILNYFCYRFLISKYAYNIYNVYIYGFWKVFVNIYKLYKKTQLKVKRIGN